MWTLIFVSQNTSNLPNRNGDIYHLQLVTGNRFLYDFSLLTFFADVSKHSGLLSSLQNQVIQSVFHGNSYKLFDTNWFHFHTNWFQFANSVEHISSWREFCVLNLEENTASWPHRAIRLALWGVLLTNL